MFTATGQYYRVYLEGQAAYVSQHLAEREAIQKAIDVGQANPGKKVWYRHEYEVQVDVSRLRRVVDDVAPSVPAGLTVNVVSLTELAVSWLPATDNFSGVASYDLERNGQVIGPIVSISSAQTGLTGNTLYTFRVRARDAAGNVSNWSAPVAATTADLLAPGAPTLGTPTGVTSSGVTVPLQTPASDTGGSGVASYTLQRATNSTFTQGLVSSSHAPGAFPVPVTGLAANTQYFWRARAVDGSGNTGAFSGTVSATTLPNAASLAFVTPPYTGVEGATLSFSVARSVSNVGQIAVDWAITGFSEGTPSPANGTLTWNNGVGGNQTAQVTLGAVSANRVGTITLSNPRNLSGGSAPTITGGTTASLTIQNAAAGRSIYGGTPSGQYRHGRITTLGSALGATGEWRIQFWAKLDASFPVGPVGTPAQKRQNWSSGDNQPYSAQDWWWDGNWLLDGFHVATPWSNGSLGVQVVGGGRLRVLLGNGATAEARVGDVHACQAWPSSGTPSLLDNLWHKVAIVHRHTGTTTAQLELWIDWQLIATTALTTRVNMYTQYWASWPGFGTWPGFYLFSEKQAATGALSDYEDYKGFIDELAMFNTPGTTTELANNWQQAVEDGAAGLVDVWRFSETSGSVAASAVSGGRTVNFFQGASSAWTTPWAADGAPTTGPSDAPVWATVPNFSAGAGAFSQNIAQYASDPNNDLLEFSVSPSSPTSSAQLAAAGLSLSSAGVLSGTYDGATPLTIIVRATEIDAEQDWIERSTAQGVVGAYGFDTQAELNAVYFPGANGTRCFLDTGQKVGAGASARFELRAGETGANIAGSITKMSAPWMFNGALFGNNSTFYVQYRLRLSPEMLTNLSQWDSNWKVSILHMNNASNAGIELTIVHPTSQGIAYTAANRGLFTELNNPDWRNDASTRILQGWNIDAGGPPWTTEANSVHSAYPNPGFEFPTNEWITVYQKIRIGTQYANFNGGTKNSIYEMWIKRANENFLRKLVACRYAAEYNSSPSDGYNNITLTPYMSFLSTTAPLTATMWVDELIISSQPIALPRVFA